ncbi:MAG: hypothetical protein Q4G60_15725 [bacterium]|nr:hypothetical protein [bacterium]
MNRLLRADFYRMYRKKWFWLCTLAMLALAVVFILIQKTAMDYEVMLDRVIFLPMSFYGVATAALVSIFIGEDFSDGVIRNKILTCGNRAHIFYSDLIVSCTACVTVYLFTITLTIGIGSLLFQSNLSAGKLMGYCLLGLFTCIAYACIYSLISIVLMNKSMAVAVCMGLAFAMLFLCLHTNQIMVQSQYQDGVLNPHYAAGIKGVVYGILHDINPSGQSAQLSAMQCFQVIRFVAADLFWVLLSCICGVKWFQSRDIK